jgi:thiamine biosynthesis lipoprotein
MPASYSLRRPALWLTGTAAGLNLLPIGGSLQATVAPVRIEPGNVAQPMSAVQRATSIDHVLGTSLDLIVEAAGEEAAKAAEEAVLLEINRLETLLSTYRPDSEIRKAMAGAPVTSPELRELIELHEAWSRETSGLIDINLGGVIALWKSKGGGDAAPSAGALRAARSLPRSWNVDALGKGYVIERAVAAARNHAPAGLLNLGGDLRAWGSRDWLIGVADPSRPADNQGPFATTVIREAAIATSGGYARPILIAGAAYSHLIDPRTNRPAPSGNAATVIASDAVTANALSTAATIAGPETASALLPLARTQGSYITALGGRTAASGDFAVVATAAAAQTEAAASAWPSDYQVSIEIRLKDFGGNSGGGPGGGPGGRGGRGGPGGRGGAKRPFVAVWIEDASGQLVRNLTLWGNQDRYFSDMSSWWNKIKGDWNVAYAVSRATRPPGTYTLAWDGRNDAGIAVPRGEYRVRVEINREHGGHVVQTAVLACLDTPVSAELRVSSESDASTVRYGPRTP